MVERSTILPVETLRATIASRLRERTMNRRRKKEILMAAGILLAFVALMAIISMLA